MAARTSVDQKKSAWAGKESGQSVLEFLFMIPVLIGIVILLIRVNSAIQISIVNQKYARAQTTWLTFNSSVYPRLSWRDPADAKSFVKLGYNRMEIGVSERPVRDTGGVAVAQTQVIARDSQKAGADGGSQIEPETRGNVRVRTLVSLCTPTFSVKGTDGYAELNNSTMGEKTVFDLCR